MPTEDSNYRELMNYAMRALSHRAHTVHELREKLKKKLHHSLDYENKVIERLVELGLLNDEDFIKRTVEDAARFRFQGPMKVACRLYQKGIPMQKTNEVWRELGISEKELAEEALKHAQKRFQNLPREKLYQKKAQFLASRGFSPEIIFALAKADESL